MPRLAVQFSNTLPLVFLIYGLDFSIQNGWTAIGRGDKIYFILDSNFLNLPLLFSYKNKELKLEDIAELPYLLSIIISESPAPF